MKKKKDSSSMKLSNGTNDHQFLVVGIGASAGGVVALQHFFTHVAENSGCAYVVILHLSPDYDSRLVELLKAVTSVPVSAVKKKMKVKPDHVYVMSPNMHVTMEDGYIEASENITIEDRRAPVDIFSELWPNFTDDGPYVSSFPEREQTDLWA